MKSKTLIIIMLICFTLILSSCSLLNKGASQRKEVNIYTGKSGLEMNFLKNSPPAKVMEKSEFPIILELSNKGAHNIADKESEEKGYITFYNNDYFQFVKWTDNSEVASTNEQLLSINLGGKSNLNPTGESSTVYATITAKTLEQQTETMSPSARFTACYDYETTGQQDVCVDTDPYNLRYFKKSCESKTITLSDQGAPVAVTKIEPVIMIENDKIKPTYEITIENIGNGEVYQYGKSMEACSKISKDDYKIFFNNISIQVWLGEIELVCTHTNTKLIDKKGTFRCSLESGVDKNIDTYSTTLKIILTYGYMESISKDIEIRRSIG